MWRELCGVKDPGRRREMIIARKKEGNEAARFTSDQSKDKPVLLYKFY